MDNRYFHITVKFLLVNKFSKQSEISDYSVIIHENLGKRLNNTLSV